MPYTGRDTRRAHRDIGLGPVVAGALLVAACATEDPGGGTVMLPGAVASPPSTTSVNAPQASNGNTPAGVPTAGDPDQPEAGTEDMDGAPGAAGSAGTGGGGEPVGAAGSGGSGGSGGAGGMMADAGSGGAGSDAPPEKFCGNITTAGSVPSDFIDYWNQITPENEGKWGSVERVRDQMSWSGLDAAYDYARTHGIPFKHHTFVWGSQQPDWIGGLSEAEQRGEVEEWIRLYCERYPDTDMIDVVNEPPPHTTPPYAQALGGAGASGYDWIVQSFQWARQYCPNSILILNDYNIIEWPGDHDNFIDIVNRVLAAGAPIDALGAQAHAAFDIPTATVRGYLDNLADTGLPIYISEYDIDVADDAQQQRVMEEQFTMFWNHEAVAGVTLWGYVEGQTWLPNTGLMSSSGEQRPAMTWLMGYLGR